LCETVYSALLFLFKNAYGGVNVQNSLQKLSPYIDDFQCRIRREKDAKGFTINTLADAAGVPVTAVGRINAGTQTDVKLAYAAALCDALGLSLDKLTGLSTPTGNEPELLEKAHKLEIENIELTGENMRLQSEVEHQTEKAALLQAQLTTRRPVIYTLLCSCAVMAFALLVYIILDIRVPDVGLIVHGDVSTAAWIVIGMIVAASGIIAWSLVKTIRRR
jgi:transcriptional regulator with XRE-family HTH domain